MGGATFISERSLRVVRVFRHPLVQSLLAEKVTLLSGAFAALMVFCAVFAPLVAPYGPKDQALTLRHVGPGSSGEVKGESRFFLIGTDHLGRDLLSRLIYGGRISLAVGVSGVVVSGILGVSLGLCAGYYKGFADDVIMRAVDVFMSVPSLLLALMVLYILGPSAFNIIMVFAISRWMLYCRVTRGMVLSLREQAFVEAAQAIGCSNARVIIRHVLPNLITPLLAMAALDIPRNILTESALSFLGFGIQPPQSSWGLMLAQGRQYIDSAWWVVLAPGMAIFLTALSFNLMGVWVRAVSDPLQRWRWLRATKESREAGVGL